MTFSPPIYHTSTHAFPPTARNSRSLPRWQKRKTEMNLLSIRNPWAYLIASGQKRIENRSQPFPQRLESEWLALHVSTKFTRSEIQYVTAEFGRFPALGDLRNQLGKIIGVIKFNGSLTSVAAKTQDERYTDFPVATEHHWLVEDVKLLEVAIPYKGFVGFPVIRDPTVVNALQDLVHGRTRSSEAPLPVTEKMTADEVMARNEELKPYARISAAQSLSPDGQMDFDDDERSVSPGITLSNETQDRIQNLIQRSQQTALETLRQTQTEQRVVINSLDDEGQDRFAHYRRSFIHPKKLRQFMAKSIGVEPSKVDKEMAIAVAAHVKMVVGAIVVRSKEIQMDEVCSQLDEDESIPLGVDFGPLQPSHLRQAIEELEIL